MNIIDIQDQLKNFSEQQLISEMQSPTGSAPQFLVLSEIKRRKRVRDDFAKREATQQPTVAQEAVASAGVPQSGIAGMAEAMAPKSVDAQQNMRSGGLMQFGAEIQRSLAEKTKNEQIDPFLDEVEQMAQTEFGVDSGSFGSGQSIMPVPNFPNQGFPAPSVTMGVSNPFGRTRTGGKGGAMLGMNRMANMAAQSKPVAELQVMPSPVQKYDEGGVVRAANGLPLGLRQNNPGNIRPGAGFIGETGQGGGYAQFGSEEEGLRALARLLGTYSDEYGINTLRGLTSRYAPRSDNEASFDNYVSYLGEQLGIDPDEEFDLKSRRDELIPAIVGFEQGRDFGDRYSQGQISRAIEAAGTDDPEEVARILGGSDEPGIISKIASAIRPISTAQAQGTGSSLMFDDDAEGTGRIVNELRGNRKRRRDGTLPLTQDDRDTMRVADSFKQVQDAIKDAPTLSDVSGPVTNPTDRRSDSVSRQVADAEFGDEFGNIPLGDEELAKIYQEPVVVDEEDLSVGEQRQLYRTGKVTGVDEVVRSDPSLIADFVMGVTGTSDDEDTVEDPAATERGEGEGEGEGNLTFSNTQTEGQVSPLQQEILDLQKRLERDRDTDKYLALAQAGLALMSSTSPTLLGAVGEAGVSGLQAYREAQDRYAEGVVDLINARAKLAKGDDGLGAFKGDAGNAVTRLGQIRRALSGADGMTLSDEERTRLLQERVFLQRALGIPEYTAGATSAAPAS